MKKISVSALALAAALVIPAVAHADPVPGWYVNLGGILNMANDSNAHWSGNQNVVQYNTGWGVEGSGGYEFNSGIRIEGEIFHTDAGVSSIKGGTGGSGSLENTDVTMNALYDFHTGTLLTPYVGGGLGLSVASANSMGTLGNGGTMNDSQMVFVWQAIAGLSAQLDQHWSVSADYRYIATSDPRFATAPQGSPNTTIDYGSHNIVVGVRYSFGKPPAPHAEEVNAPTVAPYTAPKSAVAPVPQSYMVFFDFNHSELTPEAKQIIASAAQDFKKGGYIRIVVTGHTDTVGTARYNQALSERRAASVKAELEHLGVSDASVSAGGVGKNGLMVPTADGVREAQNRRAEIIFENKQ